MSYCRVKRDVLYKTVDDSYCSDIKCDMYVGLWVSAADDICLIGHESEKKRGGGGKATKTSGTRATEGTEQRREHKLGHTEQGEGCNVLNGSEVCVSLGDGHKDRQKEIGEAN
jgi:hypothetical protein